MEIFADFYFEMYEKLFSLIFPKQRCREWLGIAGVILGLAVIFSTLGLLIWGAYGISEHQPYGMPALSFAILSVVVQSPSRQSLKNCKVYIRKHFLFSFVLMRFKI